MLVGRYPQTFETQDGRADGFPRRPASAFGKTCERLILTRLLVDSICSPGWSPADLEGVVKDERAAAWATRGEKRHLALRIATAINMVMQRSDRREPICGTRQASGHGGWLGGLKETRGKALISSCDLAHKERGPRPTGVRGALQPSGHRGARPESAFGTAGSGLLRAEQRTVLHACLRTRR